MLITYGYYGNYSDTIWRTRGNMKIQYHNVMIMLWYSGFRCRSWFDINISRYFGHRFQFERRYLEDIVYHIVYEYICIQIHLDPCANHPYSFKEKSHWVTWPITMVCLRKSFENRESELSFGHLWTDWLGCCNSFRIEIFLQFHIFF